MIDIFLINFLSFPWNTLKKKNTLFFSRVIYVSQIVLAWGILFDSSAE